MMTLVLQDTVIQAVQVIGGDVTVVQGDTTVLPCLLTDSTERLTQITWQRRTRLIKQNKNFYTILAKNNGPQFINGHDERFSFVGNISLNNGSLQLSGVTLSDEGTYTCIYTLFPSGNFKTEVPLNVLVPPKTSIKNDKDVFVGNAEVVLGSCEAARFWPRAKVEWHLGNLSALLRISQNSTENADGTNTTISTLLGAPTRDLHNRTVQCVISSPASPGGTTLPLTFQIQFPPSEVNISESSKNSFECTSEANPKANITWTWTRLDQQWPNSAAKVSGAVLQILTPTPQLNGLFECKATNTYGTTQGRLYLHLSSEGTGIAGWTMFSLLLFANAIGFAVCYYRSGKKCTLPWDSSSDNPRPTDRPSEEEVPELHPLRGPEDPQS